MRAMLRAVGLEFLWSARDTRSLSVALFSSLLFKTLRVALFVPILILINLSSFLKTSKPVWGYSSR